MEQSPSLEQSPEQGPLTTQDTQPAITKEESIPESNVNHCLSWNQGAQFSPRLMERSSQNPWPRATLGAAPISYSCAQALITETSRLDQWNLSHTPELGEVAKVA